MSPLVEVELVTLRELRRSFRSAKGGILAVLSVAGGAGFATLFAWLDRAQRQTVPEGVDLSPVRQEIFVRMYGPVTGPVLARSPHSLWMMLLGTLWLAPLLVALMNFDGISSELQYRTVRFWTVRVRRGSYMLGKYVASWLVVLAVLLGMNLIVWGVTIGVGGLAPGYVLGWGLRFFFVSLPITAAWCGIASLVGSQFRTPMLALLAICAVFFGLWLLRVVAGFGGVDWLAYAYPNAYDTLLLSSDAGEVTRGLLGAGAIALATTIAGMLLFQRKDL